MITLYGSTMNRGGRSVLALEECGVTYELHDLNLQNQEHKKPDYLKLNPSGTVPTLVDGDTVVWESMAINLYLAEKYGKDLMPSSPAARALVYQWSLWAITALEPRLVTVFANRVMLPEAERNERAAAAAATEAAQQLQVLDLGLEGRAYLCGEDFTIVDVNVGHVVAWANLMGIDMSGVPEVRRWFESVGSRPSFRKLM